MAFKDTDKILVHRDGVDYQADIGPLSAKDGKLTIKNEDGDIIGEFTANQAGDTEIVIAAGGGGGGNWMPYDLTTLDSY